jgi:ligand-binding sensor domain-containing protein/signal transduction histidine kinase
VRYAPGAVRLRSAFTHLICGPVIALVAAGAADAAQIAARRYTVEEGLAHNYVARIYQDSNGYIWFGTREGLTRFDGERLRSYGTADGLPQLSISAIVEDTRHRLWVGTRDGGLSRLIDDPSEQVPTGAARRRFRNYSISPKPGAQNVSALLADPDGSLWCLTYGGLFRVRLDGDRISAEEIAPVVDSGDDLRAFADRRGRLWFAADYDLLLVDRGRVRRFTAADGIGGIRIVGLAETRSGRILAANIHQLFEFVEAPDGPRWQPVGPALQPLEEFRTLVIDSRDQCWIGTTKALFSGPAASPGGIARVAALDTSVEALFEDRARNLWVGTAQAGAWVIPPERIVSYLREDGLPASYVQRLQETADGRIVVSTDGGFAEIAGALVRPLAGPPGIGPEEIRNHALLDRRGTWWIGDQHGLWRVRDPLLKAPPQRMYLKPAAAEPFWTGPVSYQDRAGHLWFAGPTDTIYRIDDAAAAMPAPAAIVLGTDRRIWQVGAMEESSGALWVGSHGALARVDSHGARIFEVSGPVLPRVFHTDSRGWLWIGTRYGGVLLTRNPAAPEPVFERYSLPQGLASTAVWAIAEDRSGRMYFGTGRGLDRLDVGTGRVRHFGTGDGLAGALVTDCLTDRNGRIWIATSTGVSLLAPETPAPDVPSATVLLTRVRAAGEELALPERGTPRLSGLRLDPARPDLLIEFVVPGERGRRYEYRLGGADSPWALLSTDRSLTLAHLSAGSYHLFVRTSAVEGKAPGPAAQIDFEVLRPVWQRPWFAVSTLGAAGLVLFGLHRARMNRLLGLERIRRQVALDLHDDIGSGLAQITVLNEVAKRDAAPSVAGLLDESAGVARRMRDSMSDIVWAVDPRRDTLSDLVQRMRQAAFDVLQPQGLRVTFSAPEDRVLVGVALAPDRRKHLLLILKEAITNIARHAGASSVQIVLSLEHRRLRLRVTDDGHGFDTSASAQGTGLHSFRTRAGEIGGKVSIVSSPGGGTTLDVTAPIA